MAEIDELLSDTVKRIAQAHQRLTADLEKLREVFTDWARRDLELRVRWAQYTLEVADLERQKLHITRALEQVANARTPEAVQSING